MRILITNDDGIRADGLRALVDVVCTEHEITVVAPEGQRSGAAMGLTIRDSIAVRETDFPGATAAYAVKGTPVDCVKLAVHALMDEPPDMLLSGINGGSNVGINILYSGTAAALMEGVFQGLTGMAVSVPRKGGPGFEYAARVSRYLVDKLFAGRPHGQIGLNVNFPERSGAEIRGIRLTAQCPGGIAERYRRERNDDGSFSYSLVGDINCGGGTETLDTSAIEEGYISITPIRPQVTWVDLFGVLGGVDFSGFKLCTKA
jgi:5'-nucleotidase